MSSNITEIITISFILGLLFCLFFVAGYITRVLSEPEQFQRLVKKATKPFKKRTKNVHKTMTYREKQLETDKKNLPDIARSLFK